jgi:hypothetical protein
MHNARTPIGPPAKNRAFFGFAVRAATGILAFGAISVAPAGPSLNGVLLAGAPYYQNENQLSSDSEVIVLRFGPNPESPAEFKFANDTDGKSYWTLSKYIVSAAAAAASPTSAATPSPSPSPTPDVAAEEHFDEEPNPAKHHHKEKPPDDDPAKVWYKNAQGQWKWRPAKE